MARENRGTYVKVIAVFLVVYSLAPFVYGQNNQTESFTISTYYPSPTGQYRNLKLNPSQEPTLGKEPGVMFYNETANKIQYFNGTDWVTMGVGSGTSWTVLTRTCPWGSDGALVGPNRGWGNQCGAAPNFLNCCRPPDCPFGWDEVGTEVVISAVDCPKSHNGGGCEWNPSDETWYHPVAVGHVVRKCVKKGGTVITNSTPWQSDYLTRKNSPFKKGWGDQCVDPFTDCNITAVPTCPSVGWLSHGVDVLVHTVSCPQTRDVNNDGCFWDSVSNLTHPVAGGMLTAICEKQ